MSIFVMFGGLAWFGWAVLSAEEYSVSEYANMPSMGWWKEGRIVSTVRYSVLIHTVQNRHEYRTEIQKYIHG